MECDGVDLMAKNYRLLQEIMTTEARARSQAKADRMIAALATSTKLTRYTKRNKRVDS